MISRRSPTPPAILGLALSTAALGAQQRFDLAVKEHARSSRPGSPTSSPPTSTVTGDPTC
jgi:hypothetical protein